MGAICAYLEDYLDLEGWSSKYNLISFIPLLKCKHEHTFSLGLSFLTLYNRKFQQVFTSNLINQSNFFRLNFGPQEPQSDHEVLDYLYDLKNILAVS